MCLDLPSLPDRPELSLKLGLLWDPRVLKSLEQTRQALKMSCVASAFQDCPPQLSTPHAQVHTHILTHSTKSSTPASKLESLSVSPTWSGSQTSWGAAGAAGPLSHLNAPRPGRQTHSGKQDSPVQEGVSQFMDALVNTETLHSHCLACISHWLGPFSSRPCAKYPLLAVSQTS